MAKLQAVVESLDTVPENLRELYVEREGKHYLDAEGVEDTAGLKSTLEKLKREEKTAKEALKRYEGVDPDRYAELVRAVEEAETAKLQGEGKWEEMKKRLQDAHSKELDGVKGEVGKRDRVIERLTIDNELNAAIDKAGVLPEHKRAVRALLREGGPKVEWDGDEPKGLLGGVAIAEYVESWAKTDEAAAYLTASGAGGSGARGGGGGGGGQRKPFKEMTEQDKMDFVAKHGQEEYLKHMVATS